jgi:hypothetical protein
MCSKLLVLQSLFRADCLSLVLISGLSCKTTFNKELWTSSFPVYSMKPQFAELVHEKAYA